MLFLPEGQNFMFGGSGQRGGGSIKEDEGKGKAGKTEPELEDKDVGLSVRNKFLTELLEEQWLHNQHLLAEIAQIHGALFQMGKVLKDIVLDTHDITDHLLSTGDDDGRRVTSGAIFNVVNDESADGEEVEQVEAKDAEGEK